MNPDKGPVGPEFTDEALSKKFSYAFTRRQLIILFNALQPMQLPLGDMRTAVLLDVLDEIKRTALQSITDSDYKNEEPVVIPPTQVQTN